MNKSILKLSKKKMKKTVKVSSVGIEQKNVDVPRGPPYSVYIRIQLPSSMSKQPHTSGATFDLIDPLPYLSIRELVPELMTKRLRPQDSPPHISNPLRPLGLKESVPVAPERDI